MPLHPLLARSLRRSMRLQKFFSSLTASTREQFDHFIRSVKKEDTRIRRVQQTIELLTEVMEAELDPPPLLTTAFARNAKARRGWELMPQSHRRQYLLAIFRSPSSRPVYAILSGHCLNASATSIHCSTRIISENPCHPSDQW